MLHGAIYRAAPGSVIVVEAGDVEYAVAGGNLCATAQRRGIAGFIVDGVIRDIAETRQNRFPVFARGVIPKPGAKGVVGEYGVAVTCGGVRVGADDIVVADEEGIVVVAASDKDEVLRRAQDLSAQEDALTLDEWETAHRARIDQLLREGGLTGGSLI